MNAVLDLTDYRDAIDVDGERQLSLAAFRVQVSSISFYSLYRAGEKGTLIMELSGGKSIKVGGSFRKLASVVKTLDKIVDESIGVHYSEKGTGYDTHDTPHIGVDVTDCVDLDVYNHQ